MTDERRNDLLMVLLDAIERYYRHVSDEDDAGRCAFLDTARWFESTDRSDPNTFESVCARLDFQPDRIRQTLALRRLAIRGPRDRGTP